ncbi:hypothetical protein AB5J72_36270 [Streptomyces sp. CG1]|uniref:hypothetical protein n=1 Tax=Streptomyces sp. CG1 TaxID=1287523 RepID=UPI0034E229F4
MTSESYRNKAVRSIAGAALVATVAGVAGCSKSTDSATDKKPNASSRTADPETSHTGSGSAASQPSIQHQPTAEGAVAAWVTAIIKGQPKQACLVMAFPATDSQPAQVGTPAMCNSNTPEVRNMQDNIGKFRTSFTPKGTTGDPKVDVAQVLVTGDKAVVPAGKVTVDGQPLDKVILSNSTGVKPGQLDAKIESAKVDGAWCVTNFDLHVG